MPLMFVLLAAGAVLLVGFAAGARFKEMNLRRRELQLAQGRRELRETAMAIQTHRELDWSLLPADVVVRRAVLPEGELLMVADSAAHTAAAAAVSAIPRSRNGSATHS